MVVWTSKQVNDVTYVLLNFGKMIVVVKEKQKSFIE